MSLFGNTSIKSRVMATLEKVIDNAQKKHDDELKVMEAKHDQEKLDLADKHVQSILGKIL